MAALQPFRAHWFIIGREGARNILAWHWHVNEQGSPSMKMHLQGTAGLQVIRSHGPGFITVNHDTFQESLVLTPETLVPGDWPRTLDTLGAQHFEAITRLNPEIVLLGTGTRLQHPSTDVLQPLLTTGIGYEVMDTGAACRTYNILLGEGRRVCALLLLTLAP